MARVIQLRLEPMTESHLAAFEQLLDDPEVLRFTRFPAPAPAGFAASWYASYQDGRHDGSREAFAAVAPDGEFLGLALAVGIDAEAGEMELGYLSAPAARNRGVATELLRQLTSWAFTDRGAQRVSLMIGVDNVGSQRVAAKAGYQLEGVLRSSYFKQGQRGDVQLWSRLPTDP
jgi:RimJ/RimL family protein N-acetyltransferase